MKSRSRSTMKRAPRRDQEIVSLSHSSFMKSRKGSTMKRAPRRDQEMAPYPSIRSEVHRALTFFDGTVIDSIVVTDRRIRVNLWIKSIYRDHQERHRRQAGPSPIGLAFKLHSKRPNIVLLQLSSDRGCLLFGIYHAESITPSLHQFLNDPCFLFLGVGLEEVKERFKEYYKLEVLSCQACDLRDLATNGLNKKELKEASHEDLMKEVLGFGMEKERNLMVGIRWEIWPYEDQWKEDCVCLEVFASLKMGKKIWDLCASRSFS